MKNAIKMQMQTTERKYLQHISDKYPKYKDLFQFNIKNMNSLINNWQNSSANIVKNHIKWSKRTWKDA